MVKILPPPPTHLVARWRRAWGSARGGAGRGEERWGMRGGRGRWGSCSHLSSRKQPVVWVARPASSIGGPVHTSPLTDSYDCLRDMIQLSNWCNGVPRIPTVSRRQYPPPGIHRLGKRTVDWMLKLINEGDRWESMGEHGW